MTTEAHNLCSTCNKIVGLYDCRGCQRTFCRQHVAEHNLELSKDMDNVVNCHDLLRQQLIEQEISSSQCVLLQEINSWEQTSIEKIKEVAERARRDLIQCFTDQKGSITKKLEEVSFQLKTCKELEDYSEKNLMEWLQTLQDLKQQLLKPPNIILQKINDETWLQRITIMQVSSNPPDKFDMVCGVIKTLENGCVAQHNKTAGHAEVRGFKTYSIGIHKVGLKIEKMTRNHWMFWGIISQNTAMQQNSYSSKSAYGWAKFSNQVYLNGTCSNGYGNYQGNIIENDTLHLTLNCDSRIIELQNERTNEKYSLPIDLNSCPFPWQLHINLYGSNDRIRILE